MRKNKLIFQPTEISNTRILSRPFLIPRRDFLRLAGATAVATVAHHTLPHLAAAPQATRLEKWPPNLATAVEWRYLAGRITSNGQDIGFVLSVSTIRVPGLQRQELLVQQQDLAGEAGFVSQLYTGQLLYRPASATYRFVDAAAVERLTWGWDEAAGQYHLNLVTPELTLAHLLLLPSGDLIAEGGDGDIRVGQFQGVPIVSNYDADWVAIVQDGAARGVARLDMQGLRPGGGLRLPQAYNDTFDHSWFAVAAELVDGTAVWLSAWRIEASAGGPFWAVTIAQGRGPTWQLALSQTEETHALPLQVTELAWQTPPPDVVPPDGEAAGLRAGSRWRLVAPDNALDLIIATPPGQFTGNARHASLLGQSFMVEAVGLEAAGSVLGIPIAITHLAVAESTHEFYTAYIPTIQSEEFANDE